ncbi:unnamed protein product [Arctia plantaginis]|uniref:Uncharacterized protein n=1 Tax=Arctia plantaginis TaxID=874455 RepID=A0A8S0YY13_ARCPL|nr:unnamed protein product [Arctia plantaginis]
MEHIIAFLIVYIMVCVIQTLPIENGFTVRFNPISSREDFRTKKIGRIFLKLQEDTEKQLQDTKRYLFTKTFSPEPTAPLKHTTQVNELSTPSKTSWEYNEAETWANSNLNFLNLPVISQPYADYKILVATAPPNLILGSGADRKRMIVYVVFPNDGSGDSELDEIPRIYFVNENSIKKKPKKDADEPIIIVDSNRTVTGLKSKEIEKFLKFRNKLTNRFNYEVTR